MEQLAGIELFAGAGGLGLGIGRAGFAPQKVVEFNEDCRETLQLNRRKANGPIYHWPTVIDRDVRDQDYAEFVEKIDLVSGGPPANPFRWAADTMRKPTSETCFRKRYERSVNPVLGRFCSKT